MKHRSWAVKIHLHPIFLVALAALAMFVLTLTSGSKSAARTLTAAVNTTTNVITRKPAAPVAYRRALDQRVIVRFDKKDRVMHYFNWMSGSFPTSHHWYSACHPNDHPFSGTDYQMMSLRQAKREYQQRTQCADCVKNLQVYQGASTFDVHPND